MTAQTVESPVNRPTPSHIERRAIRSIADLNVKAVCGCGFASEDLQAGVEHAETYGHTLDVIGRIRVPRQ